MGQEMSPLIVMYLCIDLEDQSLALLNLRVRGSLNPR